MQAATQALAELKEWNRSERMAILSIRVSSRSKRRFFMTCSTGLKAMAADSETASQPPDASKPGTCRICSPETWDSSDDSTAKNFDKLQLPSFGDLSPILS